MSNWPNDLIGWNNDAVKDFTELCNKILVLETNHLEEINTGRRRNSTMATTSYYATTGKFGKQPCFEKKAPLFMEDGRTQAVFVEENHSNIWLFDAEIVSHEVLRFNLDDLSTYHRMKKCLP